MDLAKHMNTYLTQIALTIGKTDLLGSDQSAVAIKAWTALVELLHHTYDSKSHSSVLSSHKQVLLTVFKKLDKSLKLLSSSSSSPPILTQDERIQL